MASGSAGATKADVAAICLARLGFTCAPAILVEDDDAKYTCADPGTRWRSPEHYSNMYPLRHWAQPPVEAFFRLKAGRPFDAILLRSGNIHSMEPGDSGPGRQKTEEAQYNQPFSDAALNGDFHNLTQEFMLLSRVEGRRNQVRALDLTDGAGALLDGFSQS